MVALVDTNVPVYRFDPRFPAKQERAIGLLKPGIAVQSLGLPYRALLEFAAAVTHPIAGDRSRGASI